MATEKTAAFTEADLAGLNSAQIVYLLNRLREGVENGQNGPIRRDWTDELLCEAREQ